MKDVKMHRTPLFVLILESYIKKFSVFWRFCPGQEAQLIGLSVLITIKDNFVDLWDYLSV